MPKLRDIDFRMKMKQDRIKLVISKNKKNKIRRILLNQDMNGKYLLFFEIYCKENHMVCVCARVCGHNIL